MNEKRLRPSPVAEGTGTQFLLLRRLRNLPVPSKFRCINSFMMAKRRLGYRISQSTGPQPTPHEAARARMHACLLSSAACSAAWKKVTWERCCSWHRRWRGGRLFDGPEWLAFSGSLLPHLCPPRLLSLSYLPTCCSGHGVPLAVLGGR